MSRPQNRKTLAMVKVCLISTRSPGKREIGDPPAFGPYAWILANHEKRFIAEMKRRYGSDCRVAAVRVIEEDDTVPRREVQAFNLRREIQLFEHYLAKPRAWEV